MSEGIDVSLFRDKTKVESLGCAVCLGVVRDCIETPCGEQLQRLFVDDICGTELARCAPLQGTSSARNAFTRHWRIALSALLITCHSTKTLFALSSSCDARC